jgi:hypothetical protein
MDGETEDCRISRFYFLPNNPKLYCHMTIGFFLQGRKNDTILF